MGKTMADRKRKYYETMKDHAPKKARKKVAARLRQREASEVRQSARRIAFDLSMAS